MTFDGGIRLLKKTQGNQISCMFSDDANDIYDSSGICKGSIINVVKNIKDEKEGDKGYIFDIFL